MLPNTNGSNSTDPAWFDTERIKIPSCQYWKLYKKNLQILLETNLFIFFKPLFSEALLMSIRYIANWSVLVYHHSTFNSAMYLNMDLPYAEKKSWSGNQLDCCKMFGDFPVLYLVRLQSLLFPDTTQRLRIEYKNIYINKYTLFVYFYITFYREVHRKRARNRESASPCVWNWNYDDSYILYQAKLKSTRIFSLWGQSP